MKEDKMITTITKENFYLVEIHTTRNKTHDITLVKNINNKLYKYIKANLTADEVLIQLNKLSTIDDDLFKTISTITANSLDTKLNDIISQLIRNATDNRISVTNSTIYNIVHDTYYALDDEHKRLFLDNHDKYIELQTL